MRCGLLNVYLAATELSIDSDWSNNNEEQCKLIFGRNKVTLSRHSNVVVTIPDVIYLFVSVICNVLLFIQLMNTEKSSCRNTFG